MADPIWRPTSTSSRPMGALRGGPGQPQDPQVSWTYSVHSTGHTGGHAHEHGQGQPLTSLNLALAKIFSTRGCF